MSFGYRLRKNYSRREVYIYNRVCKISILFFLPTLHAGDNVHEDVPSQSCDITGRRLYEQARTIEGNSLALGRNTVKKIHPIATQIMT